MSRHFLCVKRGGGIDERILESADLAVGAGGADVLVGGGGERDERVEHFVKDLLKLLLEVVGILQNVENGLFAEQKDGRVVLSCGILYEEQCRRNGQLLRIVFC